jgi:DNA polymerase
MDQYERATLLAGAIPPQVRYVLELIDDTAYSAVSKHAAAVKRVSPDGRLRGSYVLNGAAQTGRFSSTGLQVHNLPRLEYKEIMHYTGHDKGAEDAALDALCSMITQGHVVPQMMLAQAARPMVKAPPGRWLVWGDWSAIEGRALPWLAGAEDKLQLYRQGQDIYRHTAAAIFGIVPEAVSAAQRQEGKVAELALGFGGGPGALLNMARAYRVSMTEAAAKVTVRRWREANSWAVDYWDTVHRAFITAMRHPHEPQWAGRVRYCYIPETSAVWCELPSGRLLAYRDPHYTVKPEHRRRKGDVPNERELTVRRGHARIPVWHGLLVENITQATAADLLRQALRDSLLSLYVVGHTHDEIIAECDVGDVPYVRKRLEYTMATVPSWAEGLPLAVKVEDGERYGK